MNAYQLADELEKLTNAMVNKSNKLWDKKSKNDLFKNINVYCLLEESAFELRQLYKENKELKQELNPTVEPQSQNWKGMDGATAFSLIDRHSNIWSDIKLMTEEWLNANNHSAIEISHEKREEIIEKVWSEMKDALCLDHRTFGHQLIEEVLKKRGEK